MGKTTLVVLAAGIGSRYGAGIKQLEKVGCCGELIIDFSVYDALLAGFDKVVFIIRKDIEADFKSIIGDRIAGHTEVGYVFQELDDLPEGCEKTPSRKKPWGTGHALWCCRDVVKEPFVVINADDYYGREAFALLHDYLASRPARGTDYCMAGFVLGNTLSERGAVTRGICKRGSDDYMLSCEETYSVAMRDGICSGKRSDGSEVICDPADVASMNMWGLTPDIFETLDEGLRRFIKDVRAQGGEKLEKSEYLLPNIVGELLKERKASVRILDTHDRWYGITYEQDKAEVSEALKKITLEGKYPRPLFD